MDIKYNIPVTLFDLEQSNNPLYSFAKLKIFYVGMTEDKRLFTQNFSDSLLKTIYYVPVVGYFNKEKGDFEGHKEDVQYIYGFVPNESTVEYKIENDIKYAICDVLLYTGRDDETGEIAKKIVGKQHSLELNKDNTTYKINYNADNKLESIEFLTGSLTGLSILGDDERPAFDGSEFFSEKEEKENFEKILNDLKEIWACRLAESKTEENVPIVETTPFEMNLDFIKKSYSEKMQMLYKKIIEKYEYSFLAQVFDEYVVFGNYDAETWELKYYRVSYTVTEDNILLQDNFTFVIQRFYTEQEIQELENSSAVLKAEQVGMNEKEQELRAKIVDLEKELDKANTAAALNSGEREELKAFRRERKINLISSFSEDLDSSFTEKLIKEVDNHTYEELEVTLSKEFTRVSKLNKKQVFINPLIYDDSSRQTLDATSELIKRYKDK